LEDAALWEQHINKTEHAKTNIIPIFSDSWWTGCRWLTPPAFSCTITA
jgi:hypothetical protein